jgi:hypothetical protein
LLHFGHDLALFGEGWERVLLTSSLSIVDVHHVQASDWPIYPRVSGSGIQA